MATSEVTVGTTATVIAAKNYKRIELIIDNTSGSTVYIGDDDTVTVDSGIRLLNGERFQVSYQGDLHQFFYRGAIYGIANGTAKVRRLELNEVRS